GLRQHQAHGTSLVALVFTGLGGAATYAGRGAVDLAAAAALALPAMATARLGARHAHALPEWKLKRAFGAFLLVVTALLLAKPYLAGASAPVVGFPKLAALAVTGGFTGFLSGMMGVGGGSLMVPAMVLLTGFPQSLAQGSSLLAMVPAGAAGAHQHFQLGNVVRRLLPGLVPGILLGSWAGSTLALRLTDATLRFAFAAVVVYTGAKYLVAPRPKPEPAPVVTG
ncbi:MAG TPA: sulfite exporter TauE/SafE family protein, partial [Anaeromyxobacteraceae bacterium]|nr:sulfite exporter TauE/SafE family protein [Anaeromyxobacteraceae bacterium]